MPVILSESFNVTFYRICDFGASILMIDVLWNISIKIVRPFCEVLELSDIICSDDCLG